MRRLIMGMVILTCWGSTVIAEDPQWIWAEKTEGDQRIWLRKEFTLETEFKSAHLTATCDNRFTLYLNDNEALSGREWSQLESAEVSQRLKVGKNTLAVEARNSGGIAAFLCRLQLTSENGQQRNVVSNASWKVSVERRRGWTEPDFDSSSWQNATVLGNLGENGLPWSRSINPSSLALAISDGTEAEDVVQVAPDVTVPEGFRVEKVFDVPRSMGSWVSLTTDPDGYLTACDQGKSGLFRIAPGRDGIPTHVEKHPVDLSGAQGLLWAFDALYVMVNGGDKSGLHRVTDTDEDGLLDRDEHLKYVPGGGEHGPHAVILSPDGKSLYVCAGNHTNLPDGVGKSRIPMNWNEDHLLPRRWDANGHAAGRLAPGGWICKVDPDGNNWEVVSMGYRNEYDIAFNADGELFSYDADMEWDFGSPWYRPTRITHATSGSEFGWRSGTGKWPTYYEDSLPPVVNIGPGSPTGIMFGYGTKFPAKYQQALFILDWTYSTIYAIHFTPDGASYTATKEDFATAAPLQVTDSTIGSDGNLYFAVGGRGTQSTLYRISYVGDQSTNPVSPHDPQGSETRALRHQLEAFHGRDDGDLDLIFKHLGSKDRFLRYAARIALEWQPIEDWSGRVLSGEGLNTRGKIAGLLALCRQGNAEHLEPVLKSLSAIGLQNLNEDELLAVLRTWQLAFIRLGEPDDSWKQKLIATFDPLYPAKSDFVNAELVQLLVYLGSESVVGKTLDLMDSLGQEPVPDWSEIAKRHERYGGTVNQMLENMPPIRAIHLAFVLRNAKTGWTMRDRRRYFEFFLKAADHPGGNSFAKFLMQFREDALATMTPTEKIALDDIASISLIAPLPEVDPPQGPGREWTREMVVDLLSEEPLRNRNYQRGRELFHAASCVKCHRYNGEGGAIGPDLSLAGKKFPLPDLLDNIITPSKVISDQYGSHTVVTADGEILNGRVVEIDDNVHVYLSDADSTLKVISKDKIEQMKESTVSQMPLKLINSMNEEEVKDLMAYLLSGGDQRSNFYR